MLRNEMNSTAGPQGGIFIPRNGGYEGCIGQAHVFYDHGAGGIMNMVSGAWPRLKFLARLDMVFAVRIDAAAQPIQIRQSLDHSPQLLFLEEGNQRIGLRVLFKLYDADHAYHGHGMTESWFYPDGQMFITAAATFENAPGRDAVVEARLDIKWLTPMAPSGKATGMPLPLDDESSPARFVYFTATGDKAEIPGIALYWRTGRMDHNTWVYRGVPGAPHYHRWPDYFSQAHGNSAQAKELLTTPDAASLCFIPRGTTAKATARFSTLFRLALCDSPVAAAALVEAERDPVTLTVNRGGVIHGNVGGYNDQEGIYELRKIADPMVVSLPADPHERTIRIKAIALSGHSAVTAALDGNALLPQLATDGGIADDPLAPIHEPPEAPADAAIVTVKLADHPQTLTFREQEGIQLVYQSRDPRRDFAIYSARTGPRWSGLRFSLVDGHAHHMRQHGQHDWALTENLLHWFSFCGYTPEQMLDQLRDFVVLENGPDRIAYRYTSANANDGAESQYVVTARADAPAMQIEVAASFRVLEHWPYDGSQFFDVFPFRGVRTEDWWYNRVLWLTADGTWKTMETVKATYDGATDLKRISGGGFFALYDGSTRGNMLMLTRNFRPNLPSEYVICGNYIDYHMDVKFVGPDGTSVPPPKGFTVSCEYELAVWGDQRVTTEQLITIGTQSIEAGKIVLPAD